MDKYLPSLPLLEPFALLENTKSMHDAPSSFLFMSPCAHLVATRPEDIAAVLEAIENQRKAGRHLCGYLSYEAGYYFVDRNTFRLRKAVASRVPLISFFAFEQCVQLTQSDVEELLSQTGEGDPCAVYDLALSEDKDRYVRNIERIRQLIREGDTYQVNHTLKWHFSYEGSPLCLYRELRGRQSVEYAAFLNFPEARILSLSPELFMRKTQNDLLSQPMKGTARRGGDPVEDDAIRRELQSDPKTQSENVMIVDLIRNDIGRVAAPGSVNVSNLFEIQSFETVHQMISTISGTVSSDITIRDVLYNLFPCGSITGAPKIRTMEIIEDLESEPRGVYTGAIGYITPANDFCFNVPIRTVVSTEPSKAEMGIGSGIIHEANANDEFAECMLKARFLTGINEKFQLIESMLLDCDHGGIRSMSNHVSRLRTSALFFGFMYDEDRVRSALRDACMSVTTGRHKVRLLLKQNGHVDMSVSSLDPAGTSPRYLTLSRDFVNTSSVFQYHKTTIRTHYDRAYQAACDAGAYDVLFLNERGKIAEASRHNIFIEREGTLITPPVTSGLLQGVCRMEVLRSGLHTVREGELGLEDLAKADKMFLCNSVRGLVEVTPHPELAARLEDLGRRVCSA